MSHTPSDPYFISNPDLDIFSHRPAKSATLLFQAITATAVFRIWPTLLFFGLWSTGLCLINMYTAAQLKVPNTMLTVLGVLLGLTLSYRTSSAYDRYWEGRRLWSQIVLASRTWARMVWIHCPDTMLATPPTEPETIALDETRAVLEKATMVKMALAFAVAVKHYLRGEEGIFYEDLYHLVRFIPSMDLPSGIAGPPDAHNGGGPPHVRHILRQESYHTTGSDNGGPSTPTEMNDSKNQISPYQTSFTSSGIPLHPARDPPRFRWRKAAGRRAMRKKMKEAREGGGVGQNVPLEITMFMSSWISSMQKRKTIDVPTVNALLTALGQLSEALSSLERILTTPIPWSYNAHIWEVTWVYCLILPFQLYSSGFGWITVPATVLTAYIVVGFASIGEEIENPFGYDRNDLNLDFFVHNIISQELSAITARPFESTDSWIFSSSNANFGISGLGADVLQTKGVDLIRRGLRDDIARSSGVMGGSGGRAKMRARSPEDIV